MADRIGCVHFDQRLAFANSPLELELLSSYVLLFQVFVSTTEGRKVVAFQWHRTRL